MPIIEYINETRGQEPNLLPKDPAKRAKARALAEIVNAGIQPYQNTNVLKRLTEQLGEEKKNEWVQNYLRKGFRALEESLKQTSGKYCVGDELSIADLALVPQVYNGYRFVIAKTKQLLAYKRHTIFLDSTLTWLIFRPCAESMKT